MTQQKSFTQVENELISKFRKKVNHCESTEDVKKAFVWCVQELFTKISEGAITLRADELRLQLEGEPFVIDETLRAGEAFAGVWNNSDLPRIVGRFAELAVNQYRHLAKNPARTEAKIRN